MKNIVKVALLVGTILLCMFFGSFDVVAENSEDFENFENDAVEIDASCLSSASINTYTQQLVSGDHGEGCYAQNGQITLAGGQYVLDCYCVDLDITSSTSIHVYRTTEDIDSQELEGMDVYWRGQYPEATLLFGATEDYNCHSYAWYSANIDTNNYWIADPSPYIASGLYQRKTYASEGDIICYYDDEGNIDHSGIVILGGLLDSNVLVQSKWGVAGVYEHYATDCPYPTDDIVYYRRVNHSHIYTGIYNVAEQQHGWQCTDSSCGQIHWTDDHFFTYQNYNEYYHKETCACGYISYKRHTFSYTYTNAQVHTKTCSLCDGSYQDPHYEEAYSVEDNGDGTHDITCICQGIFDEEASHTYDEYGYYNGVYHKISCICGDYELEAHELSYISLDNSYHWEECDICGYENEIEHDFAATTTYLNDQYHTASCFCGVSQNVPHNEYYETSHNNMYHTFRITCCGTHTVTDIHHFDEYDSNFHTGECRFCSYIAPDTAHSIGYYDRGNGIHSGTCIWCDYTHAEPHTYMYTCVNYQYHQIECEKCDEYQVLEEHTWDDGWASNGEWCTHCIDCGYYDGMMPLTAEVIAKLPTEIQAAMQSAPQNAMQNVQSNGNVSYVIPIDEEYGILYLNGEYYLLYSPAPDAELRPTPDISAEGNVS